MGVRFSLRRDVPRGRLSGVPRRGRLLAAEFMQVDSAMQSFAAQSEQRRVRRDDDPVLVRPVGERFPAECPLVQGREHGIQVPRARRLELPQEDVHGGRADREGEDPLAPVQRALPACYAAVSRTTAIPWPPPMQAPATPYRVPRRRISLARVSVQRVPVAASGCPSAIAPPLTFSFSRSRPSSRTTPRIWPAKASLISQRSMSSFESPALSSAARAAGAGPRPMSSGSQPTTPHETSRPSGFTPLRFAFSADVTTTAAAPSTIPEALPAVTWPSFPNDGGSFASASNVVSGRMWSSRSTWTLLRPAFASTGTT